MYSSQDLTRRLFLQRGAAAATTLATATPALAGIDASDVQEVDPRSPAARGELVGGIHWTDYVTDRVALSFDDGPRPKRTGRILEILAEEEISALFFICGRLVRRFPAMVRRIVAEGHDLGNHTWSHPDLEYLYTREINEQFDRTQAEVNDVLGREYPMRYYRPPFGSPWYKNTRSAKAARRRICRAIDARGGLLCLWQVHSNDSHPGVTEASIHKSMRMKFERNKAGVMVFHDSRKRTAQKLPEYLDFIRGFGLHFTSVDELVMAKYGCDVADVARMPTVLRSHRLTVR